MKKIPNKVGTVNLKRGDGIRIEQGETPRATYEPTVYYTQTIDLPPDTRTDSEKACDAHILYTSDCLMWGVDDALGWYVSLTGGRPPEHHDPDCKQCRERWGRGQASISLAMSGETAPAAFVDTALREAAMLARRVRRRSDDEVTT